MKLKNIIETTQKYSAFVKESKSLKCFLGTILLDKLRTKVFTLFPNIFDEFGVLIC